MSRTNWIVGVAVVLACSVSHAQDRPGGPGFGRGGFAGGGPSSLIAMPEVRAELKTSDAQNAKLDAIVAEQREVMRSIFAGGFGDGGDNGGDRRARFAAVGEKMRAIGEKADGDIAKILDEKQSARLKELSLQRQGASAFFDPAVAGEIGLTSEQQRQIRTIQAAQYQGGGQGFGDFQNMTPEQRAELIEQFRARREKAEADTLAVLTDEQRAKWGKMQGVKFDFPQEAGGFGGRAGFGGAAGRRGGTDAVNSGERRRPERRDNN